MQAAQICALCAPRPGLGCARRQRLQEGLSGSCYSSRQGVRSGVFEVGDDGEDPPVVVGCGQQAQFGEDGSDVGLDGLG
jgi:hypothetical protein